MINLPERGIIILHISIVLQWSIYDIWIFSLLVNQFIIYYIYTFTVHIFKTTFDSFNFFMTVLTKFIREICYQWDTWFISKWVKNYPYMYSTYICIHKLQELKIMLWPFRNRKYYWVVNIHIFGSLHWRGMLLHCMYTRCSFSVLLGWANASKVWANASKLPDQPKFASYKMFRKGIEILILSFNYSKLSIS